MKLQSHFNIAGAVLLASALAACEKGGHGHSHDDTAAAPATAQVAAAAPTASAPVNESAANKPGVRSDEIRITLAPNQGTEVKMAMAKGQKVDYAWQTEGGPVNHDTHGEPPGGGTAHRYSKAVQVPGDSGSLVAAFDGEHGWFWRNRNEHDVSITLKVSGQYQAIKQKQ